MKYLTYSIIRHHSEEVPMPSPTVLLAAGKADKNMTIH